METGETILKTASNEVGTGEHKNDRFISIQYTIGLLVDGSRKTGLQ